MASKIVTPQIVLPETQVVWGNENQGANILSLSNQLQGTFPHLVQLISQQAFGNEANYIMTPDGWCHYVYRQPLGQLQAMLYARYGAVCGLYESGERAPLGPTLLGILLLGVVGESGYRLEARFPNVDLAWTRDYETRFTAQLEALANGTDSLGPADTDNFTEPDTGTPVAVALGGKPATFCLGSGLIGQTDARRLIAGGRVRW